MHAWKLLPAVALVWFCDSALGRNRVQRTDTASLCIKQTSMFATSKEGTHKTTEVGNDVFCSIAVIIMLNFTALEFVLPAPEASIRTYVTHGLCQPR